MKPASSPQDEDIIKILKDLESLKAEYPAQLLAARRADFIEKVAQRSQVTTEESLTPKDQEIVELVRGLSSIENKYPSKLLAARRSAFRHQIVQVNQAG